jgi:hypothetical protein
VELHGHSPTRKVLSAGVHEVRLNLANRSVAFVRRKYLPPRLGVPAVTAAAVLLAALLYGSLTPPQLVHVNRLAGGEATEVNKDQPPGKSAGARAPEKAPDNPGLIQITGEVHLFDHDGRRLPAARGHLTWSDQDGSVKTTQWITDGHWYLEGWSGKLVLTDLGLNGLFGVPRLTEYSVSESCVLVIEVDIPAGSGLRVIDEESGESLHGVMAVPVRSMKQAENGLPPDGWQQRTDVSGGSSPLILSRQEGATTYWIGAPDTHAWRVVTVAGDRNGSLQTVALARGARVAVENTAPEPIPSRLTLRSSRWPVRSDILIDLDADGIVELSGLPPGEYSARFEIGPESKDGAILLREQPVVLSAGKTTTLMYQRHEVAPVVQGRLIWPAANQGLAPNLILGRTNASGYREVFRQRPDDWAQAGTTINWSFNAVPFGTYYLELEPLQQSFEITVDESSHSRRPTLTAEVAARVHFHIEPRECPAGSAPKVLWSRLFRTYSSALRLDDGSFSFACAPGEIQVLCSSELHQVNGLTMRGCGGMERYSVASGSNDLVLLLNDLVPPTSATLHLHESRVPIPLDPMILGQLTTKSISGDGRLTASTFVTSGGAMGSALIELSFSNPEIYEITLPKLMGYRAIAPIRLDLRDTIQRAVQVELIAEHP